MATTNNIKCLNYNLSEHEKSEPTANQHKKSEPTANQHKKSEPTANVYLEYINILQQCCKIETFTEIESLQGPTTLYGRLTANQNTKCPNLLPIRAQN